MKRPMRFVRWSAAAAIVAVSTFVPGQADAQDRTDAVEVTDARILPTHPAYQSALEYGRQVVDSLRVALSFPGMAVAVAVEGHVIWAEGFGLADIDREIPVDRHSIFPIYSVSKGFTGLALARLAEQGRIDLDAPVQRYVRGFPEKEGGVVTPRLLAGHLAGIRHYHPGAGEGTRLWHCETALEGLAPFRDDPLIHRPGTDFNYTSFGFVLLSAAIAGAADQPFADVMATEVFRPLRMHTAGMADTRPWVPDLVSTYEWDDSLGVTRARRLDRTCKMGAGAFVASAADAARGASSMFSGYVDDVTLDMLFTAQTNAAGERIIEGLGWDVGETEEGVRWVRRVGGNVDAWAALMAYPGSELAIVLLANMRGRDWFHDDTELVARRFIEARAAAGPPLSPDTTGPPLVLTNGRIVDVESGVISRGTTVIHGGRITAVGGPDEVQVPENARVVDLGGRFLVPGLSDMHVHTGFDDFPLFLANGVTTVRIMMGTEPVLAWKRRDINPGTTAPRVFLAGPLMAGQEVPWPHELIRTPDEARASVERQAAAGYDFVKVYDGLEAGVYAAIIEAARNHGLPVVGHVPSEVGVEGVLRAGQRSIEHVEQLMYAWYGRDGVMTLPFDRIPELVELVSGADVFVTPTLAGQERVHRRGTPWHEALYERDEMRWMDPELAGWWSQDRGSPPSPEALERRRRFFLFQEELTAALYRAGVPLLAGTDTPYPLLLPGFSLHEELEALGRAGLSPLDVLRAGTINAARALDREDDMGAVREGAVADLVVVERNPLDGPSALRRPWAVVIRGGYLDRLALDSLLSRTQRR